MASTWTFLCAQSHRTVQKGKIWVNLACMERRRDLVVAVERIREYARSLTEANKVILSEALDITRRNYGHPKQIGAFALPCHCDRCQHGL